MDDQPFIPWIIRFPFDFDFTAKPARRTSVDPLLAEIRSVENSSALGLGFREQHDQPRWERDDARFIVFRFVKADDAPLKINLWPFDLERLTQTGAAIVLERNEGAEIRRQQTGAAPTQTYR